MKSSFIVICFLVTLSACAHANRGEDQNDVLVKEVTFDMVGDCQKVGVFRGGNYDLWTVKKAVEVAKGKAIASKATHIVWEEYEEHQLGYGKRQHGFVKGIGYNCLVKKRPERKITNEIVEKKKVVPASDISLVVPGVDSVVDKKEEGSNLSLPEGFRFPERGNTYAVVIGISTYRTLPPIKFAEADAKAVAELLQNPATGGLPTENVHLLTGSVSKSDIEVELDWLLETAANPEDTAIFFFSGHGTADEDKETYLVPFNTRMNKLKKTGFARNALTEKLSSIKAGNVIAFLDACYSGQGERSARDRDAKLVTNIPRLKKNGEVVIISSSEGNQISKDYKEKGHGVFTYHLLEGLKGSANANDDAWVDAKELFDYIEPKVKQTSKTLGADQAPEFIGEKSAGEKIRISLHAENYIKASREIRIGKVKKLYSEEKLSPVKLKRAVKEIKEAKESKALKDFLDGVLDEGTFRDVF